MWRSEAMAARIGKLSIFGSLQQECGVGGVMEGWGGGGVFGGGGGRWNIGLADGVHVVVVCGVHASVT